MEMMKAQLKRWKDTAHDALYLRERAQSLRVSLSNKKGDEQLKEIKSLKALVCFLRVPEGIKIFNISKGTMNKKHSTIIHFDFGRNYMKNGDAIQWNSREDVYHTILIRKSIEEVTYSELVDKICTKMGIYEGRAEIKLSYIPIEVEPKRPIYICDDDELFCYMEMNERHNKSVLLQVEMEHSTWDKQRQGWGDKPPCEEQGEFDNNDMDDTLVVEEDPLVNHEWEDGIVVEIGDEFGRKEDVQDLVVKASHVKCFEFDVVKSDRTRYVVRCWDERNGCKWCLRAAKHKDLDIFSIRTHINMHTCSRANISARINKWKGSQRLVASSLHEDYPGQLETPSAKTLIGLVQSRVGVKVSYATAWRGKKQASIDVRGSPEESYKMLYSYMYILEKLNLGTVSYVEVDEAQKFKYIFFALGACIEGFKVMRKVIIVDGTHLKTAHGGVLVIAAAQDPDHHHYPLAFGVVDGEKEASLTWFFEKLKSLIPDAPGLVFLTDRHQSLIKSIHNVYPLSYHGCCTYHLSQNVKGSISYVNKETVAKKFRECALVYTKVEFTKIYSAFGTRYPSAGAYLDRSVEEIKWARCLFLGERYNIDTTNTVESINGVFKESRKRVLLPMIDAIVGKLCEWFAKYRNASTDASNTQVVPYVESILYESFVEAKKLEVTELNRFLLHFNVIGRDGCVYMVDLKIRTCTCRHFDLDRYPCVHAIAALSNAREKEYTDVGVYDLCSPYYGMEQWALAYNMTIYPVPHISQWSVAEDVQALVVLPPDCVIKK